MFTDIMIYAWICIIWVCMCTFPSGRLKCAYTLIAKIVCLNNFHVYDVYFITYEMFLNLMIGS